jgi:hypothetical protein
LRLLHGKKYHERFKDMRLGEARLVLKDDGSLYLNVVFRQAVVLPEMARMPKLSPLTLMRTPSYMATMTSSRGLRLTRGLLGRAISLSADDTIKDSWQRATGEATGEV